MIQFINTVKACGTASFHEALKKDIEQLKTGHLPLQQGLTFGSYALDNKIQAIILKVLDENDFIHAKAGVFYTSIIAGCNCADDPTPVNENNEYCEVQFTISKKTAETIIKTL